MNLTKNSNGLFVKHKYLNIPNNALNDISNVSLQIFSPIKTFSTLLTWPFTWFGYNNWINFFFTFLEILKFFDVLEGRKQKNRIKWWHFYLKIEGISFTVKLFLYWDIHLEIELRGLKRFAVKMSKFEEVNKKKKKKFLKKIHG
jgi:hypothetical protein